MRELEGLAEAVAGTFNTQDVANTLWAYATMGREPGAGLMRELEGRAEHSARATLSSRGDALASSEHSARATLSPRGIVAAVGRQGFQDTRCGCARQC